ncbi:MAG TPA: DUF1674 domain-containing protein [Steroidobacteraceae bacterium]|nr:DUF1674 domain-containing protein [Steroidobacteraceae bacterium]
MQLLAENRDAARMKDQPATRDAQDRPKVPELDGPSGPEPTRYGDWERRGRCIDF